MSDSREVHRLHGPVYPNPSRSRENGCQQEIELGRIVNSAPVMLAVMENDGRISWLNEVGLDYLGISLAELNRDDCRGRIVHPDDVEKLDQERKRALSSGTPFECEQRMLGKDGGYRWFLARYQPLTDTEGRVLRWYGGATDIEDRKRGEEERRRMNADLERGIQERTVQLAEANWQLAERNEELARASRLKSEFLRRMSHELRTPLNSIAGFSELLAEQSEGPMGDVYSDYVRHVRQGADHLLALVNDILDLSGIEAGRLELRYEEFPAADAISEVLSVTGALAEPKRIDLRHEVPQTVRVYADRTRFKQILYNLVSNAVKFTPPKGMIGVFGETAGCEAQFSVRDTGIGIPKEQHAAIFEEFHQVREAGSVNSGSGLGLAITKRLVELQGGRIWVKSAPGKGSHFYFTAPMSCNKAWASQSS